jgi:hypothetical protein
MSKFIEMEGKRFGKLTVIAFDHLHESGTTRYWLCKCDCGNFHIANGSNLRAGEVKSCGCLNASKGGKTGGLKNIYNHIKQRCKNPNNDHFQWYGLKGIKICQEWENNFDAFKTWAMTNGYKNGLTIDRIDSDGDYMPENCRWVTRKVNSGNRKSRTKNQRLNSENVLKKAREFFPRRTKYDAK